MALSFDWLTPLYDLVIRLTRPESTFKRQLVEQSRIRNGHRVLDLGCGTATLILLIKSIHPEAKVWDLDGDPRILKIARKKAVNAGESFALGIACSDETSSFEHTPFCEAAKLERALEGRK